MPTPIPADPDPSAAHSTSLTPVALQPSDARLFLHAARRFDQRKYAAKKALRCYEKAHDLDPASWEALSNTAILYASFKDHSKARRYLRLALGKRPDDPSLVLYNAIELSRGGDDRQALESLRRAVAHGLPESYVDYYERQTRTRVDRTLLGAGDLSAAPSPSARLEILSTRVGHESGWKTASGRTTIVQYAEVSFVVHQPLAAGLAQAHAYLYDADKRVIKGCQATKVSRYVVDGRTYEAGAADGPRLDPGSHTLRFVWNDRGTRLRYVLCVLGGGGVVTAQAASEKGVVPLEGFAFEESGLIGQQRIRSGNSTSGASCETATVLRAPAGSRADGGIPGDPPVTAPKPCRPSERGCLSFSAHRLHPSLLLALRELGFQNPTPIQHPFLLLFSDGRSVVLLGVELR